MNTILPTCGLVLWTLCVPLACSALRKIFLVSKEWLSNKSRKCCWPSSSTCSSTWEGWTRGNSTSLFDRVTRLAVVVSYFRNLLDGTVSWTRLLSTLLHSGFGNNLHVMGLQHSSTQMSPQSHSSSSSTTPLPHNEELRHLIRPWLTASSRLFNEHDDQWSRSETLKNNSKIRI